MNPEILNKCIEELKKETPDLSYIRGMLETLVALSTNALVHGHPITATTPNRTFTQPVVEEELTPAARAIISPGGKLGGLA